MARIFEDNFTGVATETSIENDTPDTAGAGTWTTIAGSSAARVDANDRVYNSGAGSENVAFRCTDTPADADYYVETVLYKHSDINQDAVGPLARWTTTFNWYHAAYDDANARVTLTSVVAGSGTLIGTPSSQTFNATENHTVRLVCNGSTISVDWDGTEVVSTTNTDHSAAGQAGFYIDFATGTSNTTGIHIQSILAENDLPSGGTTQSVTGTASGTSSDTATAILEVGISGAASGTSTDTATATLGVSLSGTASGASLDSGTLSFVYEISGTATVGGSPQAGVLIYLIDQGTDAVIATDTTGVDGTYAFTSVAAGTYHVVAEYAGYSAPSVSGLTLP